MKAKKQFKPRNELKDAKTCRVKRRHLKQLIRKYKSFQKWVDRCVAQEFKEEEHEHENQLHPSTA